MLYWYFVGEHIIFSSRTRAPWWHIENMHLYKSLKSFLYTYNIRYNQYLSLLTLRVRFPLRWGVLDITLCDKVCQWRQVGAFLQVLWFPPPMKLTATI